MNNIYESEMEHFRDLAEEWWDPRGKLRTLHAVNPLRLKYIIKAFDIRNRQILDVGCGGGLLSESLARHSAIVTAIDTSEELITIADRHATSQSLSIDYHTCTIEEFVMRADRKFDAVTCMELLEHVPDPVSIIESVTKLLNPGGHLFLSTINRNIISYMNMIIGAEYLFNIIPRHTHHYSQFIKPSELAAWLREAGLILKDITGIMYFPLLEHAVLVGNPSVNYITHAVLKD